MVWGEFFLACRDLYTPSCLCVRTRLHPLTSQSVALDVEQPTCYQHPQSSAASSTSGATPAAGSSSGATEGGGKRFSRMILPPLAGGVRAFMMLGPPCPCAPTPLHLMPPKAWQLLER